MEFDNYVESIYNQLDDRAGADMRTFRNPYRAYELWLPTRRRTIPRLRYRSASFNDARPHLSIFRVFVHSVFHRYAAVEAVAVRMANVQSEPRTIQINWGD